MTRMTLTVIAFALALTGCTAEVSSRPTATPTKTVTVTATPDPVDSVDGHGDHFPDQSEPARVNQSDVFAAIGADKDGSVPMPDGSSCEVYRVMSGADEIDFIISYGEDVLVNESYTVGVMWGGTEEVDCADAIMRGLRDFVP